MPNLPSIPRWKTALHSLIQGKIPLPSMHRFFWEKGPTVNIYMAGIYRMILTADPDLIQHILRQNPRKYQKSKKHFDNIQRFWGKGLLTSEGNYWLQQRRLIQPGFHKARLKAVLKLMDRITEEFLEDMDRTLSKNEEVDIHEKMQEVTLRVIAHAIFSSELKEEEFQRIKMILPRLQRFILRMIRQPYLHWWLRWSGQIKAHEEYKEEENAIIRSYIKSRKSSGKSCDDLLQMLLDIRYQDSGEGMSSAQLIDEINILFIAGHETSANALAWTWYMLSKHPLVFRKLQNEVNRVVTSNEINFEKLKDLEYTQQVIEEALRLFPPIWATNRMAVEDDEFKGIPIKKGTTFGLFMYSVHRSPKLWEDPDSYRPERFSKEKKKTRHPFAFIPFGGGPRLCIGKQFAMMEMKLILAKMIKRYEVSLVDDQTVETLPLINLQPKGGIKMHLHKKQCVLSY